MATGSMDAETGFGAIAMNYIPKEGGNAFSFYGIANGANENMQNLNWDESLQARGLDERRVRGLKKNWDWGAGIGGPIVRDRLWFYTAHRWWGSQTYASGSFRNGAWDNPERVRSYGAAFYDPDFDRPTVQKSTARDNSLRLTWQASERHKITASHADQRQCLCQFWSIFGAVDHLHGPRLIPKRSGDHERPPVQVRRDLRLVGRAEIQSAIPQGGGGNPGQPPPCFSCICNPFDRPGRLPASTSPFDPRHPRSLAQTAARA